MTIQMEIGYEQLVLLAKKLPVKQWEKLKAEIDNVHTTDDAFDMEQFLLSAPTFSQKQLDDISATRKAINTWRKK